MALDPNAFTRSLLAIKGSGVKPDYSAFDAEQEARKAEGNALAKRVWNDEIKRRMGNDFTNPDNLQSVMRFDPEAGAKLIKSANDLRTGVRDQTKFEDTRRNDARTEFLESVAGLARDGSDENLARFAASARAAGAGAEADAEIARMQQMDPQSRSAYVASKKEVREALAMFNSDPMVMGSAETGMGYVERNPLSENYNGGVPRAIGNAPQAAGQTASSGDGSFESAIGPVLQTEGGFVAKDGRSGAPANFGINQRANPDIDVANLTVDQAKQIYRDRYWPKIEANVPPQARAAVFDMGVNAGPDTALRLWGRAGGDLNRFADLRMQYYQSLPDWEQNKGGWTARVEKYRPVANPASPMFSAPKAPPPAEQWVDTTRNGVPGQRNSVTQEFKPLPEYAVKAGAGAAQTPAAREAEIANSAAKVLAAKDMMTTIERAKGLAGFGETGFIGSLTRNIGGTKSLALKNMVTTLQANLSFDNLKKMRDESKTGGALGNITNRELELLASTVASLDPNMEQAEFLKSIAAIEQRYARILDAANKDAFPSAPAQGGRLSPAEAAKLPKGTRFVGQDGVERVRQ